MNGSFCLQFKLFSGQYFLHTVEKAEMKHRYCEPDPSRGGPFKRLLGDHLIVKPGVLEPPTDIYQASPATFLSHLPLSPPKQLPASAKPLLLVTRCACSSSSSGSNHVCSLCLELYTLSLLHFTYTDCVSVTLVMAFLVGTGERKRGSCPK